LGGTQQWTAYDGDNAYADFSGQTLTTRYVFANGPDEIVARTNASGNSTAWYLTDNIGSVRQIVDASGGSLYRANYFTFGGIVPGSQSGTGGDRFKFAGREWDSEIGLYYNRARYYDPNTGRFISADPLGFRAGDPNLYRYGFNGPAVSTDPSGLLVDSVRVGVVTNPQLAGVVAEGLTGVSAGGGAGLGTGFWAGSPVGPMVGGTAVISVSYLFHCAHRKGARKSTKDDHEEGRRKDKQSRGGEIGDARRDPPRKRPDGWKGPWPPPPKPPKAPPEDEPPEDEEE